jgi:hypothetical protein
MDPPDRVASTNVAADGEIAAVVGRGREKNDDEIDLGLVVTLALGAEDVEKLLRDLERVLAERYPGVSWKITAVRESLLAPPAGLAELVDAARSRLLEENWDLVLHVTELPLRISRRPRPRPEHPAEPRRADAHSHDHQAGCAPRRRASLLRLTRYPGTTVERAQVASRSRLAYARIACAPPIKNRATERSNA